MEYPALRAKGCPDILGFPRILYMMVDYRYGSRRPLTSPVIAHLKGHNIIYVL